MIVERIRKLDINNRPIFTGIYGNSYAQEFFVENNLCKYNFHQELYRYLRSEGYTTLFYNAEFNFFSYEESQLETFFFKKPEDVSKQQNNNHASSHRFIAPISSPNGHNRRKGIRLSQNLGNNNQVQSHNGGDMSSSGNHDSNPQQLVSHRPNAIFVKNIAGDQFFQLKRSEGVLSSFFDFVDKNPDHKVVIVFTKPSEIAFPQTEREWRTRLQTDYNHQRVSNLRHRIIVCYDVKDVMALHESFNRENGFFFDKWFSDQLFPNYNDSRQDLTKPSNALFCVGGWGLDEVGNVLKRQRIIEGLKNTLSPISFDDLCLRVWQQFQVEVAGSKKEREIDTVMDMMSLPKDVLEKQLQKMDNEKAINKLKKLRGMEGIIVQFERYLEDLRFCRESGEKFRKHMVFMGNPGTGKTTVARIFADILREEGLLENGRLHAFTVGDLVSQYVGETRIKTQDVCQRARGGILFLDEAYGLFKSGNADTGGASANNQFGEEAIEVLLQFMENDDSSLVIMAGYPADMEDMLKNGNSGLESRIGEQGRFVFEDYKPEVLLEIALAQIGDDSYTDKFKQKLLAILTILSRFKDKTWANARTVENIISKIKSNYRAKHLTGPYDVDAIPDDYMRMIRLFTPEEEKKITKELDEMVGLDKVKTQLHNIFDEVSTNRILLEKLGEVVQELPNLTFVFEGNPGTGKTSVARLMGKILAGYGLLLSPEVKEYGKDSIVSGVQGGSVKLVNKMFDDCIGKVLFIDEAYTLANQDGKEAVDQIVQNMTLPKYQGKMAIILAGYPGDMEELMGVNDGIERRFSFRLRFDDYTNEQLTQMYKNYITKEGLMLADGCEEKILDWFKLQKRGKHFANGGLVKDRLHKNVKALMGGRFKKNPTASDRAFYTTILPEDIPDSGLRTSRKDGELSSSWEKLNELKGIDSIRQKFQEYVELTRYCLEHPTSPVSKSFRPHMAFLGNPGTGKSTVARIFGKILQEEGLLLNNNFVEVSPDALIGQYVGQTAPKARKEFERARGGVLFIDEAYELYKKGKDGGGNQYGQEAITALIKFMEDDRDTIIILAGYTDEIRHLIKYGNPGLTSRVTNEFFFEDYHPDVLFEMLLYKLGEHEVSDNFARTMRDVINNEYEHRNVKEWGNARTIENYYTEIFRNYLVKHHAKGIIDIDCIPSYLLKGLMNNVTQQAVKTSKEVDSREMPLDSPHSLTIDLKTNPVDRRVSDTTMLKERATGLLYSSSGEGTGFIVSLAERYILTCSHVVEGAGSELSFIMNCNREFSTVAHVVWHNYEKDLALLQVDELPEDACFIQLDNNVESQPKELTELILCGYPDGSAFASTPSLISGSINNFEREHVWNDRCFDTIYANISATHGCSGGPVVRKDDMVLVGILQGGKEGGEIQFITDIHQLFKYINIIQ